MTPAAKTSKEPIKLERSNKTELPVTFRQSRIQAMWDCTTASFTVEDLRRFIEHVDLTVQSKHPFSLQWQDSNRLSFWVRVKDGNLYAASSMITDNQLDGALSVPWAALKRAFQATIAKMAEASESAPREDT